MGKGTIISHTGDGQYQVLVQYNVERVQAEKAANLAKIANLTERISEETDEQKRNVLKLQKLSLEKRNEALDAIPETKEITAWCADLTEDLTGEVGLIEVPGESVAFNVQPGYEDNAAYDSARDGQLTPTLAMTPAAAFYNLAMLPGWQKWKPTFRYGTITAIAGDIASVSLDATTSTQQGLWINQSNTLTEVEIDYMDCDGMAFEIGDEVLVKFTGQNWDNPVVIGFKDNPKTCLLTKLFVGVGGYVAVLDPETLAEVERWQIFTDDMFVHRLEYGFDGYLYATSSAPYGSPNSSPKIVKIDPVLGTIIKTQIISTNLDTGASCLVQNPYDMCLYIGFVYGDYSGIYKIDSESLNVVAMRRNIDRPEDPDTPFPSLGRYYHESIQGISFDGDGSVVYICGDLCGIREEPTDESLWDLYTMVAASLDTSLGENISEYIVSDDGAIETRETIRLGRDGYVYSGGLSHIDKLTQALSLDQNSDSYDSGSVFNFGFCYSWDGVFYTDASNYKIIKTDFPNTTVYDIGYRMYNPRDGGNGFIYSDGSNLHAYDYSLIRMSKTTHIATRKTFDLDVRCIAFNWPLHLESMDPEALVNGTPVKDYLPKDRIHPSSPGGEDSN